MRPAVRLPFTAFLLLLGVVPAARTDADDRLGVCVFAQVRTVSAGRNELTVSVQHEEEAVEHTLRLPKDVRVAVLAKPEARLADLKPDMRVAILLSADERSVRAIREWKNLGDVPSDKQPGIIGVLKSADGEKRRLTVTVQEANQRPAHLTLAVSSSATATTKNNQPVAFDQLKPGARVLLTLREPDGKVRAVAELAEEPRKPAK
ncbi:MAG: hypothetical protein JNM56_39845 [Planctomycetia bacterium]|nr:hypothetical protein [Planctomycetia bacterium]